jgi:hypothetical protein
MKIQTKAFILQNISQINIKIMIITIYQLDQIKLIKKKIIICINLNQLESTNFIIINIMSVKIIISNPITRSLTSNLLLKKHKKHNTLIKNSHFPQPSQQISPAMSINNRKANSVKRYHK